MYRQENEKIRLSIEKAERATVLYLKEKLAYLKKDNEHEEKVTNMVTISHIEDLLNGIHLLTNDISEECGYYTKIYAQMRNNSIEALANEFPDLVLK